MPQKSFKVLNSSKQGVYKISKFANEHVWKLTLHTNHLLTVFITPVRVKVPYSLWQQFSHVSPCVAVSNPWFSHLIVS